MSPGYPDSVEFRHISVTIQEGVDIIEHLSHYMSD